MEEKQKQLEKLKKTNLKLLIIFYILVVAIIVLVILITSWSGNGRSVDDFDETKYQIESFNSKYTAYMGKAVTGSTVKSLMIEIRASNAQNEEHQVLQEGIQASNQIRSSKMYEVEAEYDEEGYINKIIITENQSE